VASQYAHRPVLLSESLSFLDLHPGGVVVDGTLGGGGHAAAILESIGPDGRLVALDVDDDAIAAAKRRLTPFGDRAFPVHASFRDLPGVLAGFGIPRVDGVLFDLGVSSFQLDDVARGFRFADDTAAETPLDMRMDRSSSLTAAELLHSRSAEQLERIFRDYGELPGAARLARAIVAARRSAPLRTARDLRRVISAVRVGGSRRHHPATLVFQALRIAVNDELAALEQGLEAAIEALRPTRRLVVLAYHSLEDRIVKNRFRDAGRGCSCPPGAPVCVCGGRVRLRVLTKRPIRASRQEVEENPRARSARLRAAERVAEAA
jgi:16S rRNA (cytosine1402-N4)-methyltransferase